MTSRTFKFLFSGSCMAVAGISPLWSQERPNILWLSIEDTSPYDFGCYGNSHVSTPNIDSLAESGIQYMRAHSVGPQSSPSRSGIITGCYPSTYGMDWHRMRVATPEDIFLPEIMRRAGYYCTNKSKTDYNTKCDNAAIWDECGADATYNNPGRRKDQPFFAVFNSMATHMGRIRSFHTDGRRDFSSEGLDPQKLDLPPHVPDIPEIRSDFAFHMEGSQDIDKWVGIFLEDLKKQGLDEDTIIFFFSDHGGCLPRGKGFLYETGTHVPLVVYLPPKWRHLANGASGKTDRLVGFPDLAPTVLSLAGIEPPAYMQGKAFLGKYEAVPKEYEFGVKANQASHYNPERSVTDGRYKLIARYIPYKHDALMNAYQWGMPGNIWWDDYYLSGKCREEKWALPFGQHSAELFYDLEKDPYELDNLIDDPEYADEVARLRNRLSRFVRETKDLGFFLKDQRDGDRPLYDRLRETGYDFDALYDLVELTSRVSLEDLPYLEECLGSDRKEIRYWAVVNICELADKGLLEKAPDSLLKVMETDDADVACEAAYALCLLGHHGEAMEYLTGLNAGGRLNSSQITMLELLSMLPQARSFFSEEAVSVLQDIASVSADTGDENMMQYPVAARKVLVNLRLLPATDLWGPAYYQEGLKVNRDRRKLIPVPSYVVKSRE